MNILKKKNETEKLIKVLIDEKDKFSDLHHEHENSKSQT